MITARQKYCVLSFDTTQQIITESSGEVGFPGQPHDECHRSNLVLDPSCRYFAATLYNSTVTIIIPENERTKEHTATQILRKSKDGRRRQTQDVVFQHPHDYINIRYTCHYVFNMHMLTISSSLQDKKVISLAFLQDSLEVPTLLILYDDALGRRYLQAFTVSVKTRELIPGDIVMDHFESDANILISMPAAVGGVVLIAGKFIRYLKPNQPPIAIGIRPSTIIR